MVNKAKLSIALRLTVSFGLLFALVWIMHERVGNIIDILKNSNKLFFILALFASIPLAVLLSYRLKLLLLGQKILLPMKDLIYLTFIGFFFNNFLPTSIGGDIVKAHYTSKKTNNKVASYAAVLSDRMFGFFAILCIAMIGLSFIGKTLKDNNIIYAVFIIFVLLFTFIFFLLIKKSGPRSLPSKSGGIINNLKDKLYRLYSAINLYRKSPLMLIKILLLSIFMQVSTIVSIYLFILCLGGRIDFLRLFLIIPIVWAMSMLPSINGLGVREGAFVYLLKESIGTERAFAVSLLWLSVIIIYSMIGGILHLCHPVMLVEEAEE